VDAFDIEQQTSLDAWGNGIPDECERDCNGNGMADYSEIQANMALDLDRNGELDACQDCDGDGTLDATVLAGARHWWVASNGDGSIRELNARSGVRQRTSAAASGAVVDLALGADGLIYGTRGATVVRWNPVTGALVGTFVAPGSGGLSQARGLLFLPDGTLLVASQGSSTVLRYDAGGSFLNVFATLPAADPIARPHGLARRADGAIAVSASDGRVYGFNAVGASIGVLADLNPLAADSSPSGLLYLPSGDLLVASRGMHQVHRFDGASGAHLGRFDVSPIASSSIALKTPMSMQLVADGKIVLVTSQTGTTAIIGFNAVSGYHTRTYRVYSADAPSATGLLVMPSSPLDCNGNLVPDSCDIASGTSPDANGDGTPDECQVGPWNPADLNFDGAVNGADLGMLLGAWGVCPPKNAPCPADLNGDGAVNGADLGALLSAWT
ncbi:MAG: hypothetical protein JNK53_04595, partial [Phycisphaerae bacterium]|nr:hypothetical protein [Phycisphaerae bacterium]